MIHEFSAITNTYVSVPIDMGHFNCAAFLAGIIAGVLDSAKFVRFILSFIVVISLIFITKLIIIYTQYDVIIICMMIILIILSL